MSIWQKKFYSVFRVMAEIGRRPVALVWWCALIITLSVLCRYAWRGEQLHHRIDSDAAGYYAYLPAVLIYRDLSFDFYRDIERTYHGRDSGAYFLNYTDGMMVNKYFAGEALLLLPFFLAACLLSALFGLEIDGYNGIFQVLAGLGAVTYVFLGLRAIASFLSHRVSKWSAALSIAAVFLGTNLFYYTTFEALFSHAFSFFLVALFIWQADRSVRNPSTSSYLKLALVASFIVLTRPTNILIILLLPFIAGSWKKMVDWFVGIWKWNRWIPGMLIVAGFVSIQSVLYYLQEGKWWISAYGKERFYFSDSHLFDVLFSYRAGLFVWAPVLFPGIIGAIVMAVRGNRNVLWFFPWFLLNAWLISCWWVWHYEGTFGARSMVDHLAPLAILLALVIDYSSRHWKVALAVLIAGGIGLQQFQTWQRVHVILPWSHMDSDKYWALFLRSDERYAFRFADIQRDPLPWNAVVTSTYFNGWDDMKPRATGDPVFRGAGSFKLPEGKGVLLEIPCRNYVSAGEKLHVRMEVMSWFEDGETDAGLTLGLGADSVWQNFSVGLTRVSPRRNSWHYLHQRVITHEVHEGDTLRVTWSNTHQSPAFIDDLRLVIARVPPQ